MSDPLLSPTFVSVDRPMHMLGGALAIIYLRRKTRDASQWVYHKNRMVLRVRLDYSTVINLH